MVRGTTVFVPVYALAKASAADFSESYSATVTKYEPFGMSVLANATLENKSASNNKRKNNLRIFFIYIFKNQFKSSEVFIIPQKKKKISTGGRAIKSSKYLSTQSVKHVSKKNNYCLTEIWLLKYADLNN